MMNVTEIDTLVRIFERQAEPIWIVDPERYRMLWANPAALRLWGAADVETLRQRDYASSMSAAVRERITSYRQQVADGREIEERWTFYPDDKPVTLDCRISGLVMADGALHLLARAYPRGTMSTLGLREEEVLRHSGVLISAYDMEGALILRNPAAARALLISDQSLATHFVEPGAGSALLEQVSAAGTAQADLRVSTGCGDRSHRVIARRGTDPESGQPMIVLTEIDVEDITTTNADLLAAQRLYRQLNEIVLELSQQSYFQHGQLDLVLRLLNQRVTDSLIAEAVMVALPSEQIGSGPPAADGSATLFPIALPPALSAHLLASRAVVVDAAQTELWPPAIVERAGGGALAAAGIWIGQTLAGVLLLRLPAANPSAALLDFAAGLSDQLSTVFVSRHRQRLRHDLEDSRDGGGATAEAGALSEILVDEQLIIQAIEPGFAEALGSRPERLLGRAFPDLLIEADRPLVLGHLNRTLSDELRNHRWRSRLLGADGEPLWFELTARRNEARPEASITIIAAGISTRGPAAIETRFESAYDALTGALNRRETDSRLRQLDKPQIGHAVAYFNIDDFRVLNTLGGTPFGDRVLCMFAELLHSACRPQDFVGRMGADEFLLAMPETPLDEAQRRAEEIQKTLRKKGGELFALYPEIASSRQLTACVGLTPMLEPEPRSELAVVGAAFGACLDAKAVGPGTHRVYDPAQAADPTRRSGAGMLPRVVESLKQPGFELFVEPIVALENGQRGSVPRQEVLLRMRDADGSLVAPARFLPAAERNGLMPEIDRWVVSELSRALNADPALEASVRRWHVNVSGRTISDPAFVRFVAENFRPPSGDGPGRLCLEITESATVDNLASVARVIRSLRGLGVEFAIDDFGVGQATYDYLRTLNVDYLKIDGSFVRKLPHSPIDRAIVKSIVDVSAAFEVGTIAEYIESAAVEAVAIEMGVDFLQGYALSRPLPIAHLLTACVPGAIPGYATDGGPVLAV